MAAKTNPQNDYDGGRILDVRRLTMMFGGLRAVSDFDMAVPKGGLYGLIGPNGAGKTTVFNMITGIYAPTLGSIIFAGRDLVGLPPHSVTQVGVARTFQNIRLFSNLTVLDNVRIAYHTHAGYSLLESIFRVGRFGRRERELTEKAQDFLAVFGLQDRQLEIAKNLPYGEQRRLEIARALATEPRLLLLDEPAAGMNPTESGNLMELIHFIRDRFQLTILLIEHQMRVVMGICEWITVMDFGQVIARGTPRDIQSDERVIEAYLGANGAGKSTTLRTISGLLRPIEGDVRFKDRGITKVPAENIVRLGISQVPEGRRIFARLTVRENLEMGAFTRSDKREIAESMERVFTSFPRLKERLSQFGGTLSGGEQQMLAMGRGLMTRPALLLLDEPSMGLAPILVEEIFNIIQRINAQGTSILLVEQNAAMALSIASRGYVLETGRIVLEGSAHELLENPQVQAAYLGG